MSAASVTTSGPPRIAGLLPPGTPTVDALLERAGLTALPRGPTVESVERALRELAAQLNGSDPLRHIMVHAAAAQLLAARDVKYADRMVRAALHLHEDEEDSGPPPPTDDEPWPDAVDGPALLAAMRSLLVKYTVLPPGAADMLSVFALATHAVDAFNAVPYVMVSSPTASCGKTRLLEMLQLLVRRPWRPAILTGPVLFRGIEQYEPTLLLDEAEVVRQRGEAAENVRAVLHVGYRRGATVERCVGDEFALRSFRTFGFKVFAAIGDLPGTLLSRCIPIPMRRRGAGEQIARFVPRECEPAGAALRRQCRRWVADNGDALRACVPSLPEFLDDRRAEIWEPLFAVAGAAGGEWGPAITQAAATLAGVRAAEGANVQLLADLRVVMGGRDKVSSRDLVAALTKMEDRPWPEWSRGKPLTTRQLAALLRPFGIGPKALWIAGETQKGYEPAAFEDAWARYLPRDRLGRLDASVGAGNRASLDQQGDHGLTDAEQPENSHQPAILTDLTVEKGEGGWEGADAGLTGPPPALVAEWGPGPDEPPPGDEADPDGAVEP
jgi:Protein of unknown function (DUF3631)